MKFIVIYIEEDQYHFIAIQVTKIVNDIHFPFLIILNKEKNSNDFKAAQIVESHNYNSAVTTDDSVYFDGLFQTESHLAQ